MTESTDQEDWATRLSGNDGMNDDYNPIVILAGGKGTRLGGDVPKPLVMVGDSPLVRHVMDIYISQGESRFILLGGYRVDELRAFAESTERRWGYGQVQVFDTGEDTQTGGRLLELSARLPHHDLPFHATYADGLADLNMMALWSHHWRMVKASPPHRKPLVTLTAVNPVNRFGKVSIEDGRVVSFSEKMADECGWVNGGFYIIDPDVLSLIPGNDCIFEKDILPLLAYQGRLAAYQHPGEFLCVDTPRDLELARQMVERKEEFWRRWAGRT